MGNNDRNTENKNIIHEGFLTRYLRFVGKTRPTSSAWEQKCLEWDRNQVNAVIFLLNACATFVSTRTFDTKVLFLLFIIVIEWVCWDGQPSETKELNGRQITTTTSGSTVLSRTKLWRVRIWWPSVHTYGDYIFTLLWYLRIEK